jgi:hypothetical protein
VGSPLARFVLRVLAWLPAMFAVWMLAAPLLIWPSQLVVRAVSAVGMPHIVRAVEQQGATLTFATALKPGQASGGGEIAVDVNALLYAYGLPLYAALVLGTRERGWPRRLLAGYAAIVPVVAFGVLADFLKNVAITSGALVASQTGFSAWQREAIAFAFQLGSLILPTVVPAVVWVLTHRRFLESLRR